VRALAVAVVVALLPACGGDDDPPSTTTSTTVLAVDDVVPAIAAVEAARGGAQQYTEINVNADGVSLFVLDASGQELAYFYGNGALQDPGAPTPSTGAPFTLDAVDRGVAPTLVRETQERFPGAEVTALALVSTPDTGLTWALKSRSPRGGVLNVLYSPNGELVSVSPAPG